MEHPPPPSPTLKAALDNWENEGGAPSRSAKRYQCGRRGAWSRSWSIYDVKTQMPATIAACSLHSLDPATLRGRFEMR
jgi:hypothetical protein